MALTGLQLLAACSALLLAWCADAQVLEIDDLGNVRQVGAGWSAPPRAPELTALQAPPERYAAAFAAAAADYGISVSLLQSLAWSESRFDPDAVSPAGAIGLMQLMPETARALGVDPRQPLQNIRGGAAYLRQQLDRFDGDLEKALAAYNAGPGWVEQHHGVPPFAETRRYVASNLERLASDSLAAPAPVALFSSTEISGGTP